MSKNVLARTVGGYSLTKPRTRAGNGASWKPAVIAPKHLAVTLEGLEPEADVRQGA